jgi:hypothetical protein
MNSTPTYQHTQNGKVIVISMGAMAALIAIIGTTVFPLVLFALAILVLVAWLFHSLTIEIAEGELCWRFGPGWIHKHVTLDEIVSAKPVRISVLEGWGIHYSRFGWLYNVSGFGAVAITLRSGKRFCLGTDEPEVLAAKLEPISEIGMRSSWLEGSPNLRRLLPLMNHSSERG